MCVIWLDTDTKTAQRIEKDVFKRSQEINPHGMGIMYPKDGELFIWKTLDDFETLWNHYTTARDLKSIVAVHFRKGTVGADNSLDNVHPFEISPGFAFMHNGTIKKIPEKAIPDGMSDSRIVNRDLFQKLPGDFLSNHVSWAAIEALLAGDRMLFMDKEGGYSWIDGWNKGAFTHNGNVWMSKKSEKEFLLTGKKYTSTAGWNGGTKGTKGKSKSSKKSKDKSTSANDHPPVRVVNKPLTGQDSDEDFIRRSSDEWYRKRSEEVAESSKYGNALQGDVIFDYGLNSCNFLTNCHPTGIGYLEDAALWEMDTGEPGALYSLNTRVKGRLYYIKKNAYETLVSLDDEHGVERNDDNAPYVRVQRTIQRPGDQSPVTAWVYMANPDSDQHESLYPVTKGDWSAWCSAKVGEGADVVVGSKDDFPIYTVVADGVQCVHCGSTNTYASPAEWDQKVQEWLAVIWCMKCTQDEEVIYARPESNDAN